ncbi:MAG: HAMP domain-containing sensor histidine kinase [Bacteroidota bacterium]
MINILEPLSIKNWSRLGKGGSEQKLLSMRPMILLSQFAVAGLIAGIIHAIFDIVTGSINIAFWVSWFIVLFAIVYTLNENKRHKASKFLFLIVTNFTLYVYANIFPKETGIYFLFFPIIGGSFIFLIKEKPWVRKSLISLPIFLLLVLEITGYQLFESISITLSQDIIYVSFVINLSLATAVFSSAINYLFKLNQKSEKILSKRNKELKIMTKEIEEKNETLEKANKELDRFAYSTSHDLRAPLTSMLGLINIAKDESIQPSITDYLGMMEKRISTLDSFIKDITDYSRNSRTEITPEDVNFNNLFDDIFENYKYLEEASEISFMKDVALDREIRTDKARLQVVLNNLVCNAIKYHDRRKVKPEISLRVEKVTERELSIAVRDNGPGIPFQLKDRVFDMFYRASEKSKGSGLGLYIVKETVEKMQGNIQLKTQEGVGSEFIVNLPICDN